MTRHHDSSRRAFTLIEALASLVVVAVLGSVSAFVLLNAMDEASRAATEAQLHTELSIALDRIDREMRNVPARSGSPGVPDITSVSASSIVWNTDWSLSYAGSTLSFVEDGAASAVLLGDVSSFVVQTYDESNAALGATLSGAGCNPIRRVSIQATLLRHGVTQTLRLKTFLRCTMEPNI